MHRHTPLTPVSLALFHVVPVLLPAVRGCAAGRLRPAVGDDATWFLRISPDPSCAPPGALSPAPFVLTADGTATDGVVEATVTRPFPPGRVVLHADLATAEERPATTGFPVRVQLVSRGPDGDVHLRDVHRAPRRSAGGRDGGTHVLVHLAVRRHRGDLRVDGARGVL